MFELPEWTENGPISFECYFIWIPLTTTYVFEFSLCICVCVWVSMNLNLDVSYPFWKWINSNSWNVLMRLVLVCECFTHFSSNIDFLRKLGNLKCSKPFTENDQNEKWNRRLKSKIIYVRTASRSFKQFLWSIYDMET